MKKNSSTIRDNLGSLMMPRLEVGRFETDSDYRNYISSLIERRYVGGFCIFGGTVESLPIILDELQSQARRHDLPPLIMSCDCEWGLPMRLNAGGTEFPHLMALAQMGDRNGIRRVAAAIGTEMSALGLHWNFAPVADINSNPNNPIINIRAFSGNPQTVADCAKYFFEGLADSGIAATAKHFPGHGDTAVDSHRALPSIDRSLEEFEKIELYPFNLLIKAGIPAIMTGHIAAPKLAESLGAPIEEIDLPATISPTLTQKLLHERLHFNGIIVTDSLEMHGLQTILTDPAEIAIRAFISGADILLMPTDPVAAHSGLLAAFDSGRISEISIRQSLARIELFREKYVVEKTQVMTVQWLDHQVIADSAAANALSLVGLIPKPLTPSSVIILASGSESERKQLGSVNEFTTNELPAIRTFIYSVGEITGADYWGTEPLIISIHRPRGALTDEKNTGSVMSRALSLLQIFLTRSIHPIGVVALGDPYIADSFAEVAPGFVMKTFSDSMPSVKAALTLLKENIIQ
ncbi:MAG: glycoside hydrolase family 3 N-terminal domain-containing protein [Ignavibacteriota bacterium]